MEDGGCGRGYEMGLLVVVVVVVLVVVVVIVVSFQCPSVFFAIPIYIFFLCVCVI